MDTKSKPSNSSTPKPRNNSIDLMRIVAMAMIVTWHFFVHGNVDNFYDKSSVGYSLTWAIMSITVVAVNCYVLISGYFLTNSSFRLNKLISLAAQVLFYSVGIYALLVAAGIVDFTKIDTLRAIFPTLSGVYWFATVYVGMYILSPFMNKFVHAITQQVHLSLIVALVAIFSIWPTFIVFAIPSTYERLTIDDGLSLTWFVVLYFIAAYMRLYYAPTYKTSRYVIRYLLIAAVVAIAFVATDYIGNTYSIHFLTKFSHGLHAYNSLAVLASSLALFMVFINLRIRQPSILRMISVLAPLTFGVYLIHDESHMRTLIWNFFEPTAHAHNPRFALYGISVILLIYLTCSAIDWGRLVVFGKLGRLSVFKRISGIIESILNLIIHRSLTVTRKIFES